MQRSESQPGVGGKGGSTALATALPCSQSRARAGKGWAATGSVLLGACPAHANSTVAQLGSPERVRSPARAYTRTYTKINTHPFIACPLWSRSCLKATAELQVAKAILKVSRLNFSKQSQPIHSLPLFAA